MDTAVITRSIAALSCANLGIRWFTNPDAGSKVTTIAFQIHFVHRVLMNLLMHNRPLEFHLLRGVTDLAINQLLAYFIYDLAFLLSSARGRAQWPYVVHHVGSAYFLVLALVYPDIGSTYFANYGFLALECANPLMNCMKLANYHMPGSATAELLTAMTQFFYGFTRMILYPWLIYEYADTEYVGKWYQTHMLSGHILLYLCSAMWFWQLCTKTRHEKKS